MFIINEEEENINISLKDIKWGKNTDELEKTLPKHLFALYKNLW